MRKRADVRPHQALYNPYQSGHYSTASTRSLTANPPVHPSTLVIRRSGEHIINHTDTIGSDVSLVMGEFAIHTQVVESFSSKLGLQVPWLFVYVSQVICSSGQYLSMSDAQAGGNLMCKECKAPRTTSGAGALSCDTAVFGFFSDSGPGSTSEAILDDYATECDEADGSPDKPRS